MSHLLLLCFVACASAFINEPINDGGLCGTLGTCSGMICSSHPSTDCGITSTVFTVCSRNNRYVTLGRLDCTANTDCRDACVARWLQVRIANVPQIAATCLASTTGSAGATCPALAAFYLSGGRLTCSSLANVAFGDSVAALCAIPTTSPGLSSTSSAASSTSMQLSSTSMQLSSTSMQSSSTTLGFTTTAPAICGTRDGCLDCICGEKSNVFGSCANTFTLAHWTTCRQGWPLGTNSITDTFAACRVNEVCARTCVGNLIARGETNCPFNGVRDCGELGRLFITAPRCPAATAALIYKANVDTCCSGAGASTPFFG